MKKIISVSLSVGLLCFCCSFSSALPPTKKGSASQLRNFFQLVRKGIETRMEQVRGLKNLQSHSVPTSSPVMKVSSVVPSEMKPAQVRISLENPADTEPIPSVRARMSEERVVPTSMSESELWGKYKELCARAKRLGFTSEDLWAMHSKFHAKTQKARITLFHPEYVLGEALMILKEFEEGLEAIEARGQTAPLRAPSGNTTAAQSFPSVRVRMPEEQSAPLMTESELWTKYKKLVERAERLGWTRNDLWGVHSNFYGEMEAAKVSLFNPEIHLKRASSILQEFERHLNSAR